MLELASLKITLHHNVKAGIVGSVAVVCFTPLLLDKDEQVCCLILPPFIDPLLCFWN